ncbi:MAG: holo-ACP synthase [Rudaea sp.]
MIVGLGLDLVDVRKMARSLKRASFKSKVFAPAEIAVCSGRKNSAECYAGKFAVKEALMKALGKGIDAGLWFSQIQVLSKPGGEPSIAVSGPAEAMLRSLGPVTNHVSITHSGGMAAAIVILEK